MCSKNDSLLAEKVTSVDAWEQVLTGAQVSVVLSG